jgi:hypothetical protein
MSTHVIHVKVIENVDAHIETGDYDQLYDAVEDSVPEDNFFLELADRRGRPLKAKDGKVPIERFNWGGEGSGIYFLSTLCMKIVPHIRGKVVAIAAWEGGTMEIWLVEHGMLKRFGLEEAIMEAKVGHQLAEIVAKKGT